MKTLYETLMDDEKILMDKVKQQANNPFLALKSFQGEDWKKYEDEIISIAKLLPLPKSSKLKNTNYTFDTNNRCNELRIKNDDKMICAIIMDPAHSIYDDNRDIIIMCFEKEYFPTSSMKIYSKKWNLNQYFDRNLYHHYASHLYNTLYI